MKNLKVVLLAAAVIFMVAAGARADTYQIQYGGVNITYDEATGDISSTTSPDPIDTATYKLNGTTLLIQTNPPTTLELDINTQITAGLDPTVNATTAITGGGIYDFLISGAAGLQTNITSGSATFSNNSVNLGGTGFF